MPSLNEQYSSPKVKGELIAEVKGGGAYNGKLTFTPVERGSVQVYLNGTLIAVDKPKSGSEYAIFERAEGCPINVRGVVNYKPGSITVLLPPCFGELTVSYELEVSSVCGLKPRPKRTKKLKRGPKPKPFGDVGGRHILP
jgi:hypothetical protein